MSNAATKLAKIDGLLKGWRDRTEFTPMDLDRVLGNIDSVVRDLRAKIKPKSQS